MTSESIESKKGVDFQKMDKKAQIIGQFHASAWLEMKNVFSVEFSFSTVGTCVSLSEARVSTKCLMKIKDERGW